MTRWVPLVLALFAVACSQGSDGSAWFDGVSAATAEADRLELAHDLDAAREALERALAVPPRGAAASDVRVVQQDLRYRLAMLHLRAGRAADALREADAGLGLGRAADVFTANLLVVRGKAHEAAKDASAASRDYHDALVINEGLLEQALGGGGEP